MNKSLLTFLLTFFTLNACQLQTNEKNEPEEFSSEAGNFIINFPLEPTLAVLDSHFGVDTYKTYRNSAVAGEQMIYMVDYTDLPKSLMESWSKDELYDLIIQEQEEKYSGVLMLTKQEPTEQYNLKGQYFEFSLNPNANIPKGVSGSVKGKIFFVENRIYAIYYLGEEQKLIEPFLNSFRLIK